MASLVLTCTVSGHRVVHSLIYCWFFFFFVSLKKKKKPSSIPLVKSSLLGVGEIAQLVVECLPSMHKALGSSLSTTQTRHGGPCV